MKFKVISDIPASRPKAKFYRGKLTGRIYRISGNGYVDLETGQAYPDGGCLFTNNALYEPIYSGSVIQIEVE